MSMIVIDDDVVADVGGWEVEDGDLSIDLDSLMLMLEDSDANQRTDQNQMAVVECVPSDVQQGEVGAIVSSLPGNFDQGHGSCLQITSPIHSCSGSLKDWIPLGPNYESFTALNGASNVPHSRISSCEESEVSREITSQNLDLLGYDDSYTKDDQYQFVDSLPPNSTVFFPTQYDENSNGLQFFDTPSPYFSDSLDFHSMASNEDVMNAGRDEDDCYILKTEYGDRSSDHSPMGRAKSCKFDCNVQDMKDEDVKSSNSSFSYNDHVGQKSQSSTYPFDKYSYVFNDLKMDMNGYKSFTEMNEGETTGVFNHEDRSSSNIDKKPQLKTDTNIPGRIGESEQFPEKEQVDMFYNVIGNLKDSKSHPSLRNVNGSSGHASETTSSCYVFNDIKMGMNGYKSFNEMNEGDTKRGFNHEDRSSTNIDRKPQLQTAANLHGRIRVPEQLAKGEQADIFYSGIYNPEDSKSQASLRTVNGCSGQASETVSSSVHKVTAGSKLPSLMKFQKMLKPVMLNSSGHSKIPPESIQSNPYIMKSHVDDNDVCIIEEISQPPGPQPLTVTTRYVGLPHQTTVPISYMGAGELRPKINDESQILQVAMQDLSQPRTEMDPPEGVLAVPLLRHQRIALSWMVNKETAGMTCSGGILADDQGLGKTISTIALILKERSLSSKPVQERSELVTLDMDDDEEIQEVGRLCAKDTSCKSNGRPSAGTLVVCPTSVLRQWADELHNKVTREANLTVLVYHGSSRTRVPSELAKYDVVITTYAIVSMEVPKQPLVDQEKDEENLGMIPSRKRKLDDFSDKKKRIDKVFLESDARPLARVGWFRVVLDEAQSIKNHRTQVARACWGLRAKRRWCLSGTPIQNSIDDLYSYFRFLKYEPYSTYQTFCASIKNPIQKNPAKGYKKLQAVLKTVMLRRTKGTSLDGEPIINLPPKTIELRKLEFSKEERDFYLKLEAECRAQFAEYAAAGTVNKNYVNILLMLLFLRQACDHPNLVKKCALSSVWRSTVEDAKKVPINRRTFLVNCLEGGLTLCGICNDVPEDAVISVCGHIFCNQCILECLTGDDNLCPMAECNIKLSASSVFSKEALVASMSDQPGQGNLIDPSNLELELAQTNKPTDPSYCSTKLKAAIEVLQSLPKCNMVSKYFSNSCQEIRTNQGDGEGMKLTLTDKAVEEKNSRDGEGIDLALTYKAVEEKVLCDREGMKLLLTDKGVEEKALREAVKVVGEKAIVFSQWTRMLDLLESGLKNASIEYRRLDGTMSVLARDKAVKDFNTMPEVTVMIMSLKAASLGLNMVAACHVLMLDLWWNPTTEDQAVDRAHRIGQTRPVKVIRLTVKDTVEDRILALQQKKREMVSSAFGEDEKGGKQSRLTVEDLKYLFMA